MVVIWLNTRMPHEGGLYQWAQSGDSAPSSGFMVGWNLWIFVIVLSFRNPACRSLRILPTALGPGHESLAASKLAITIVSVTVIGFLVGLSIVGLSVGKWLHNFGGFMLVVIFLAIVFFGMRSPNFHPFHLVMPAANAFNLNILAKMGFGALGGFEYVAIMAGECRDPVRSIRRSVLISAPIVAGMFILGTASMLALVPIDQIGPHRGRWLKCSASVPGRSAWRAQIVPVAIVVVMILRVAQSSVQFYR